MDIIGFIIFLAVMIGIGFRGKTGRVPKDGVIIIDRNGHFHKKLSSGRAYFLSVGDEITTYISPQVYTKTYDKIFETEDEIMYRMQFIVTYHSEDMEQTLKTLEQARRSIDDVICCAVYNILRNYSERNLMENSIQFEEEIIDKISRDALALFFMVDRVEILRKWPEYNMHGKEKFTPHISENQGPIKS